ncbi:MAG: hypothetical protein ACI4RU_01755 [Acutalibacteraceae bacterium]
MKKGKKFIIGIILIVLGVIGLFGMFGDTEDKSSLAIGSVLLVAAGVALVMFEKKKHVQNNETLETVDYTLNKYDFQSGPTVDVCSNCEQIGNNPKIELSHVLPNKPTTVTATDSINKSCSFKVAGVTFKNDDGKSRQTILRRIRWNDEPFETVEYTLKKYDFQGEPAIGVYANGEQIGNVPKTEVSHILPLLDKITSIRAEISGGGYTESNEAINYGVNIIISYK